MQLPQHVTPAILAGALSQGSWKQARHLTLLSDYLVAVAVGLIRRLQVNMPPRHGKTLLAIRYFIVWYLMAFPTRKIMYIAKSEEAAAEESEAARDLIEEYGWLFGIGIRRSKSSANNWQIVDDEGRPTGGGVRALGRCSAVHGKGANIVLLDDLFGGMTDVASAANRASTWRWLSSSVRTRLTPDGCMVSIGTPLHPGDHFGCFEKTEKLGGDKWVRLRLHALSIGKGDPLGRADGEALWPEMFPTEKLLETREHLRASGEYRDWCAQYMLDPLSGDGLAEFPATWLPTSLYFVDFPANPEFRIISVDPSQGRGRKSDYFAIVIIYLTHDATGLPHYWIDCDIARRPVSVGQDAVVSQAMVHQPNEIIVESNNDQNKVAFEIGKKINEACRAARVAPFNVMCHEATDGGGQFKPRIKITLSPLLQNGQIHIRYTPGGRMLMSQLEEYPHAGHDDGPDAVEQGITRMRSLGV